MPDKLFNATLVLFEELLTFLKIFLLLTVLTFFLIIKTWIFKFK